MPCWLAERFYSIEDLRLEPYTTCRIPDSDAREAELVASILEFVASYFDPRPIAKLPWAGGRPFQIIGVYFRLCHLAVGAALFSTPATKPSRWGPRISRFSKGCADETAIDSRSVGGFFSRSDTEETESKIHRAVWLSHPAKKRAECAPTARYRNGSQNHGKKTACATRLGSQKIVL